MGNTIICKVGAESILLDIDSKDQKNGERNRELWRAETYETKEPDTIEWIDSFFQEGDVVYDIGANIGQYSLYAAKKLRGNCRILAFEPEALNYSKLNKNIVLNGLTDSIVAYCLAISDKMELDVFYVQDFVPGAALHSWKKPETQGEVPFSPQNRQGMMAVSLDDLTGQLSLAFPNHIKIDVDGIEELVVDGAQNTLADPRLKSALVEIFTHKGNASRINTAFLKSGFMLHNADSIEYKPGIVQNFIYRR
ncbi:FkbM family methyltransferase [Candidatus Poribacteria bacterium]